MQSAIPSSVSTRMPEVRTPGAFVEPAPSRAMSGLTRPGLIAGVPVYIYAIVFSSFCVVMGVLWDIMWHMSIGRDGLFAAPHLVIYVGAVVAGLFSAYQILSLTLVKNHPGRATAVPFWGVFYGPLGAMFCVWGALAMLTSAPFDDWWHNTYGLDVEILTPPHTILAIGIMMVQFGAMVGVVSMQNQHRGQVSHSQSDNKRGTILKWLFAVSAALLLTMIHTLASETLGKQASHSSIYYATAAILFPVLLFSAGRGSLLRWPVTTVAGLYMLFMLLPSWVLQFMPATPRLGPVLNPITTYQPFVFPLLLIVPGFVMDVLMHRFENRKMNEWLRAALYGMTFLVVLLAVQWPFGEFLLTSPLARNHVFMSYSWIYFNDPNWKYRFSFAPWNSQAPVEFLIGFGKALLITTVSTRLGLMRGNWMKMVVR